MIQTILASNIFLLSEIALYFELHIYYKQNTVKFLTEMFNINQLND